MPNLGRRVCHARQDFAAGNASTTASMPRPVAICRLAWARGLAAALLLAALGSVAAVQATEPLVSRALMQDATLWAIDFVDQEHGWAVGDRGVIWRTDDGGQNWVAQRSPVTCQLTGVDFLDARHGWAVGGTFDVHTHSSRGVVIFTNDGGETWTELTQAVMPALRSIKMIDGRRGFAWGQPSGLYPSAVFATDDSGRTWIPLASAAVQSWQAADFVDAQHGAVAGPRATVATVRRRALGPARFPAIGARHVKGLKLQTAGPGWLVGSGGLVLTTNDQGQTWQLPPSALPPAAYEEFDFKTVAVRGPHCWIAGTPGTRILYTPDAGRSWHWIDTGQSLPIHALQFIDPQHGFACGALGTILATSDGGRTWRRQRAGGGQLAVLGLFGDHRGIGWELFAQAAAGEGYLSHIAVVGSQAVAGAPSIASQLPERFHSACLAVGASGGSIAWQFPLPPDEILTGPEQILSRWDSLHQRQGLAHLEEYLVRQIRLWRPEVIVTHAATPAGNLPLEHIMSQVVIRAADRAASSEQFPQQIQGAGLKPHQVKKVIGVLPPGQSGDFTVATAQIVPRLAQSLGNLGEQARALLDESQLTVPNSWAYRVSHSNLPGDVGGRDLMSGVVLHPGGDARRTLDEAAGHVDRLRQVQQYQNIRNIMRRADGNPQQRASILSNWGQLTGELSPHARGQLLFTLAQQHRAAGRWAEAAEVFQMLVRSHPDHATVPAALTWLTHYHCSAEVSHQAAGERQTPAIQTASAEGSSDDLSVELALAQQGQVVLEKQQGQIALGPGQGQITIQQGQGSILPSPASMPRPLAGDGAAASGQPAAQRAAAMAMEGAAEPAAALARINHVVQLATLLERRYPTLYAEPTVRFPIAAALAAGGQAEPAHHYYGQVNSSRPRDAWWRWAAAERWLADQAAASPSAGPPSQQPPKRVVPCVVATEKPYLDGKLDDAVWLAARPIPLASPARDDGEWGAVAYVAHDDEFLYLAATCRRAPGVEYADTAESRPRDGDLSRHDRVEFLIDIDRDAATYYRLAVDHRGWPNDGCWGDAAWNPSWFIAVEKNEAAWTLEAAIPLKELTSQPPAPGTAWALGVQRIVPGVGFQSWTQPADPTPRAEGFGLLLWESK